MLRYQSHRHRFLMNESEQALSDGNQALEPNAFIDLMEEVRQLATAVDRRFTSSFGQQPL